MTETIPYDAEAEESVAGGALAFVDELPPLLQAIDPADFHMSQLGTLWSVLGELHASGSSIDHVTIGDAYRKTSKELDLGWLTAIRANGHRPRTEHVEVILRHSASRRLMALSGAARAEIGNGADPYDIADRLSSDIAALDTPVLSARQQARTLDDVIAMSDDMAPWIIPGMLRSDWRCVVVAREGGGKSTLLRQIGACSAQGVHPLKFNRMDPIRVLIVDLENPAAAIAETGARMVQRLRTQVGDSYDPQRLRILMRQGGMDLRSRHDRTELEREVTAHRPDLVIIGPVYKMLVRRDRGRETESHEESTDPVLRVLDDMRTRHGFALLMEHHAPQGQGGSRELRPYGSQRWLAWPEIGLGMRPEPDGHGYALTRWRGDRLKCDWPESIHYGSVWPWEATWATRQEF